jgi:hypothetical protein
MSKGRFRIRRRGAKMPEYRKRVAPNTVAYADEGKHKLVVEFSIKAVGAETKTKKIEVKKQ